MIKEMGYCGVVLVVVVCDCVEGSSCDVCWISSVCVVFDWISVMMIMMIVLMMSVVFGGMLIE